MKIIIDHRELRGPVAKHLFEAGVEIDAQSLSVGDFVLSDDVCVELKKVPDFVNSLLDGRLFVQAKELRHSYEKPMYILEGELSDLYEVRNVNPKALRTAIVSLMLDFSIPFLFSSDPEETAEFLSIIAKREQEDLHKEISLRANKRARSLSEQQQFFIEGLPSIGPSLAKNLLKHFGSVKAILAAEHSDLCKVDKVGEKKAASIRNVVDSEYSE